MHLSPSREGVEALFRLLQARAEAHEPVGGQREAALAPPSVSAKGALGNARKHCAAGSSNLTIDPVGNVSTCVQWRRPVGNLHRQRIGDIWSGSSVLDEVRGLAVKVSQRVAELTEEHEASANFCPGLAEQTTGNAVGIYPSLQMDLQVAERLADEAAVRIAK